jgi:hypothetical protein
MLYCVSLLMNGSSSTSKDVTVTSSAMVIFQIAAMLEILDPWSSNVKC